MKIISLFHFIRPEHVTVFITFLNQVQTRGHDGADFFLMNAFVKSVAEGKSQIVGDVTGVKGSLRSHKLVFAAEKSRKNNGKVIDLEE